MSFFKKLKTDIGVEQENKKPKPKAPGLAKEKPVKKPEPEIKIEDSNQPAKEKPKEKPKKEVKDWLKSAGQLAVDVFQTDAEFCVQAPIAGINPEDIDISVENDMLIIRGERREVDFGGDKNYFYQECYWGEFSRQILLPEDADTSRIKASLKKGVLIVKIPRVSKIKKKKVSVTLSE